MKQAHPSFPAPQPAARVEAPVPEPEESAEIESEGSKVPALDAAAADELGTLLDERVARDRRKRKREILVTLLVVFSITGGGTGWFVQNPDRVQALKDAIREIRSVGDVKSIVANFQASLDRVGARSQQLDQATATMGVTASPEDLADPNMDAEMKELMGGDGKTVGQRNSTLQKAFGERADEHGAGSKEKVALKEQDSFSID